MKVVWRWKPYSHTGLEPKILYSHPHLPPLSPCPCLLALGTDYGDLGQVGWPVDRSIQIESRPTLSSLCVCERELVSVCTSKKTSFEGHLWSETGPKPLTRHNFLTMLVWVRVISLFTSQVKEQTHIGTVSLSADLSLSLFHTHTHTHTHTHSPVLRSSPRAALCCSCCKFVYVCPVFSIPPPPSPLSLIFFLLHSFVGPSCEIRVKV